jgi:hypothetical protein
MADTISATGTYTVTINGTTSKYVADNSVTIQKTGSNAASEVINIGTAAWTPLNTGSLSDLRYAYFANESTGTIQVTFSQSFLPFTTLLPNDSTMLALSNSIGAPSGSLWARAISSSGPSILYYIVSEG